MSGHNHPIAWRNNPEDLLLPHQLVSGNFKSLCSCCSEYIFFQLFYVTHLLCLAGARLIFDKRMKQVEVGIIFECQYP
jgi:hypothetical protein